MSGPAGNSEFCFSETPVFPRDPNIESLGETTLLEVRSPLILLIEGFVQQNGFNIGDRVCLTESGVRLILVYFTVYVGRKFRN